MKQNKTFDNNKLQKAGGLVFRTKNGQKEVLLISSDGINYSFPKGHLEANESIEDCAVREVFEETGLKTEIIIKLPDLTYQNPQTKDNIVVHLFQMEVVDGILTPENEKTHLKWIRLEEAEDFLLFKVLKAT